MNLLERIRGTVRLAVNGVLRNPDPDAHERERVRREYEEVEADLMALEARAQALREPR